MIDVTQDYKTAIANSEDWLEEITFELASGDTLVAKNPNIWQGGLTLEDTVSGSGLYEIGSTHINQATITLWNGELSMIEDVDFYLDSDGYLIMNGDAVTYEAVYDNVDFTDAIVTVKVGLPGFSLIQKGKYIVSDYTKDDGVINVVCYDYMHKLSRTFDENTDTALTFPCTLGDIADWVCVNNGVTLGTSNFPHYDLTISAKPSGFDALTYREIIGYVAMIAVGFARFNRFGQLTIQRYNAQVHHEIRGMFNHHEGEYIHVTGVKLNQHYTYETSVILDDGTVDVSSEERDVELYSGTDDYRLSFDYNPLIEMANAQTICNWMAQALSYSMFYIYDITKPNDPTIEAGDTAIVTDAKNQTRNIVISSVTFSTGSEQTIQSNAERPSRTKIERPSNYAQGIEDLKRQLERQQELRMQTSADIAESAEDAKKTADNYVSADNTGIMVADMRDGEQTPSTATGRNVRITDEAVEVRDGQEVIAQYGDKAVIGKASENHVEIEDDKYSQVNSQGLPIFRVETQGSQMQYRDEVYLDEGTMRTFGGALSTEFAELISWQKTILYFSPESTATIDNESFDFYSGTSYPFSGTYTCDDPNTVITFPSTNDAKIRIPSFTLDGDTDYQSEINVTLNLSGVDLVIKISISYDVATKTLSFALSGKQTQSGIYFLEEMETAEWWSVFYLEILAPSFLMGTSPSNLGGFSLAVGQNVSAEADNQVVFGINNVPDPDGEYVIIVGNGNGLVFSNAFTLDWDGNLKCNNIGQTASANASYSALDSTDIDTFTEVTHITLPKGVYTICAEAVFSGSGTSARNIDLDISPVSGSSGSDRYARERIVSANGSWAQLNCSTIIELTAQTDVYAKVSSNVQTSGWASIKAVRIK